MKSEAPSLRKGEKGKHSRMLTRLALGPGWGSHADRDGGDWRKSAPLSLCCKQGAPRRPHRAQLAFLRPVSPSTSLSSHRSLCLSIQWALSLGSQPSLGVSSGVRDFMVVTRGSTAGLPQRSWAQAGRMSVHRTEEG